MSVVVIVFTAFALVFSLIAMVIVVGWLPALLAFTLALMGFAVGALTVLALAEGEGGR